jgi:hypothetical protein
LILFVSGVAVCCLFGPHFYILCRSFDSQRPFAAMHSAAALPASVPAASAASRPAPTFTASRNPFTSMMRESAATVASRYFLCVCVCGGGGGGGGVCACMHVKREMKEGGGMGGGMSISCVLGRRSSSHVRFLCIYLSIEPVPAPKNHAPFKMRFRI